MDVFTQDPSTPHNHQCGLTSFGKIEGFGCGHSWTHVADPQKTRVQNHMCPKCGKGPWYHVINHFTSRNIVV